MKIKDFQGFGNRRFPNTSKFLISAGFENQRFSKPRKTKFSAGFENLRDFQQLLLLILLVGIILISGCSSTYILEDGHEATHEHLEEHEDENKEEAHIHADFKVYINDKAVDFSVKRYQLRANSVHVEDGIGEIVHIHTKGITVGDFFKTLDIEFNRTCIAIPTEGVYCNEEDEQLSFYVNGIENNRFEDYEIRDMDKILISYGKGDIKQQLETITDLASEK